MSKLHFLFLNKVIKKFKINSKYSSVGDQSEVIEKLVDIINKGEKRQILLEITCGKKKFTMVNVIARVNKPTLILVYNKTLVVQLYAKLHELFPQNYVKYFISYNDYEIKSVIFNSI